MRFCYNKLDAYITSRRHKLGRKWGQDLYTGQGMDSRQKLIDYGEFNALEELFDAMGDPRWEPEECDCEVCQRKP